MGQVAQGASILASIIILVGYWLLFRGSLAIEKKPYHYLIICASALMGFSSVVIFNIGSLILNAAFVVIALISISRISHGKAN